VCRLDLQEAWQFGPGVGGSDKDDVAEARFAVGAAVLGVFVWWTTPYLEPKVHYRLAIAVPGAFVVTLAIVLVILRGLLEQLGALIGVDLVMTAVAGALAYHPLALAVCSVAVRAPSDRWGRALAPVRRSDAGT
jgi:hypothetical protein